MQSIPQTVDLAHARNPQNEERFSFTHKIRSDTARIIRPMVLVIAARSQQISHARAAEGPALQFNALAAKRVGFTTDFGL